MLHVGPSLNVSLINQTTLASNHCFLAGQDGKLENLQHPESDVLQGTAEPFHDPLRRAACV